MNFLNTIAENKLILTEGSVVERIRRHPLLKLDEHLANSLLIYSDKGREVLRQIYVDYINIAQQADLPILILSPTWRANKKRIEESGSDHLCINEDNVSFLKDIRKEYGGFASKILIGGLIGCANDAYKPQEALSLQQAAEFHSWQLNRLFKSGVDFFIGSTLPNMIEAAGIAKAMSEFNIPGIISFVIRKDGRLLDGITLHNAVFFIDSLLVSKPSFYMINCVHPSIVKEALTSESAFLTVLKERLIGIQANTSSLSPEELDGSPELQCEDPSSFAQKLFGLHKQYGFKILGGCCGTDEQHIAALAKNFRKSF